MKFQMLQDRAKGILSFELLNEQEQSILSSVESYPDREACTADMTATIEALRNDAQIRIDGRIAQIVDTAGRVLMQSDTFPTAEALATEMVAIRTSASENENIDVTLVTTTTRRRSLGFETVDYAALYDFSQTSRSNEPGFDPFQYESDEQFYFLFNGADGSPILFSRSFSSISKRDARIRQIIKSASRTNRFEQKTTNDGQVFFIVKASNGSEIARSRNFASSAEAEAAIAYVMTEAPTFAPQYPEPEKRKRSVNNAYEFDHPSATGEEGFEAYRSEQNKLYYFHFNDASGQPTLFSEGYSSGRSRDNGIKSVIKNSGLAERYEIKEAAGQYYISLRAGNRQEIARSKTFPDKVTAEGWVAKLIALIPIYAERYGVTLTQTQQREDFALNVGIAASATQVFDDYNLDAVSTSGEPGFESFYGEKQFQYFFHFNDPDGQALLYSEGYTTDKSRDNGIRSVIKNSFLDERFTTEEDEKGRYFTLKAGNHQEIARSRYFSTEEERTQWILWVKKNGHTYAEGFGVEGLDVPAQYLALPLARAITATVGSEDDYDLTQLSSSGEAGFEAFKSDQNQQFYFHFNDPDGQALFYSEGYTNDKSRDNGIRSVIKNSILDARFMMQEDESGLYYSLKAGNHQEIGRSRYFENEAERANWLLWFKKNAHQSASAYGVAGLVIPAAYAASPVIESDTGPILPLGESGEADAPVTPTSPVEAPAEGSTSTQPVEVPTEGSTSTQPVETPTEESTSTQPVEAPAEGSTSTQPVEAPAEGSTSTQPVEVPAEGSTSTQPVEAPAEGSTSTQPVETPTEESTSTQPVETPATSPKDEEKISTSDESLPPGVLLGAAAAYEGYLNWGDYQSQQEVGKTGFDTYQDPDTGLYYWVYLNEEKGEPLFVSPAHQSEDERDAAALAALATLPKEENYQLYQSPSGYYYYGVADAEGKSLALSTPMETSEQARAKIGTFFGAAPALAFGGFIWDWAGGQTQAAPTPPAPPLEVPAPTATPPSAEAPVPESSSTETPAAPTPASAAKESTTPASSTPTAASTATGGEASGGGLF
ncbi:MAG: DUF1508 domain-containing protein, partial [Bacteroidota bacterium]